MPNAETTAGAGTPNAEWVIEEQGDRLRAYVGGKLVAKATRSTNRDGERVGWLVQTVVPTRQAAWEALDLIAGHAHPKASAS